MKNERLFKEIVTRAKASMPKDPLTLRCENDEGQAVEVCKGLIKYAEGIRVELVVGDRYEDTSKNEYDVLNIDDENAILNIVVSPKPVWNVHYYEKWEGGFIQGFYRTTDGKEKYYVWTHVRTNYLKRIVEEYGQHLSILQ